MSEELSLNTIVNTVNKRYNSAKQNGYNNHFETIAVDLIHKNPADIFFMLNEELQSLQVKPHCELSITLDEAVTTLIEAIFTHFRFVTEIRGENWVIFDVDGYLIGSFYVSMYNPVELGTWVDIDTDSNKATVNLNLTKGGSLTSSNVMLLWHEVGHAIHHITNNLQTIAPDLWELGGALFEELCYQYFKVSRTVYDLKKDLAVSFVDLELSLSTEVNEEDVIKIVEHVQNYVGVDLSMEDLGTIIFGQYGGCYFTYPYTRKLVGENQPQVIEMIRKHL